MLFFEPGSCRDICSPDLPVLMLQIGATVWLEGYLTPLQELLRFQHHAWCNQGWTPCCAAPKELSWRQKSQGAWQSKTGSGTPWPPKRHFHMELSPHRSVEESAGTASGLSGRQRNQETQQSCTQHCEPSQTAWSSKFHSRSQLPLWNGTQ